MMPLPLLPTLLLFMSLPLLLLLLLVSMMLLALITTKLVNLMFPLVLCAE
jgi:hypothetical protein